MCEQQDRISFVSEGCKVVKRFFWGDGINIFFIIMITCYFHHGNDDTNSNNDNQKHLESAYPRQSNRGNWCKQSKKFLDPDHHKTPMTSKLSADTPGKILFITNKQMLPKKNKNNLHSGGNNIYCNDYDNDNKGNDTISGQPYCQGNRGN